MRNFLSKFLLLIMIPGFALAKTEGMATVAYGLLDPVTVFGGFVNSACLLLGGAFLFASIIKYFEHRRSPTMVPISTVIFLLIAGLLLLALPLTSYITNTGLN